MSTFTKQKADQSDECLASVNSGFKKNSHVEKKGGKTVPQLLLMSG